MAGVLMPKRNRLWRLPSRGNSRPNLSAGEKRPQLLTSRHGRTWKADESSSLTAFRLRSRLYDSKPDSCGRNCVLNNIMFSPWSRQREFSHLPPFRSPLPHADVIRRKRLRHYSRVFGR
jgi:hypothetical protein